MARTPSAGRLLALTLAVSLLVTLWSQWPQLHDRFRVTPDVQNFYWMDRYREPDLFATDYLWGYRLVEWNVLGRTVILLPRSLGFGLLFYLPGLVTDHIWASKTLIFLLMPLSVGYLFRLGQAVNGAWSGVSVSLLFVFFILASPLSISINTGVQRAFAVPLLIVFTYYMVKRRHAAAVVTIFINLLIYFPNFPVLALAYLPSVIKLKRSPGVSLKVVWGRLLPFAGMMALSAGIVLWTLAVESTARYASKATPIAQNPLYQFEGATPMVLGSPILGRVGLFDMGTDLLNFLALAAFGLLIYAVVGRQSVRRMPPVYRRLLVAGLAMYAASLVAVYGFSSFALYLPSRYTRSTLFFMALSFVGFNWVDFLRLAPGWFGKNRRLLVVFFTALGAALAAACALFPARELIGPALIVLAVAASGVLTVLASAGLVWAFRYSAWGKGQPGRRRQKAATTGLVFALTLATLGPGTLYIRRMEAKDINPTPAERDIFAFVSTLPKDAVLAGDPQVMTGIPAFARRSVLFRALQPDPSAPVLEYFDAQYAEDPRTLLNFCRRYGVDYLVRDSAEFEPDYLARGDFFYNPWNEAIARRVAGRSEFVLPKLKAMYASGPLAVIRCDAQTVPAKQ